MPKSRISNIAGTSGFSKSLSFRLFNGAGITAAIGLAALPAFLTLSPVFIVGSAHAETTENLGASATIHSTLGLSATSINMSISPSSTGAVFKTGKTVATVSTNNETGYTLYLSDSDSDNALKHSNLTNTTIPSITSNTTGTNMAVNTWGYTLGNSETEGENEVDNEINSALTYSPIPTVRTVIKKTDNAVSTESTAVTFGVKVNTEIPSGVYSDQVAITAVPNYNSAAYEDVPLWLNSEGVQISTLQEMTHDICASVPTPMAFKGDGTTVNADVPQITLTDARDGSTYIVRKLADGNCWMSENLKLSRETIMAYKGITDVEGEDPADVTLESTLTDINGSLKDGTTEFTLPKSQTATTGTWEQPPTQAHIYTDTKKTYYENGTTKKENVDDGSPEYYQNNYYNYWAATLNSGGATGDAPSTICPKNWTLPANGSLPIEGIAHVDKTEYDDPSPSTTGISPNNENSYSYTNLARLYRMAYSSAWGEDLSANRAAHYEASKRFGAAPLSFPLSGNYDAKDGVVYQESGGFWWSSTATSNFNARRLALRTSFVRPQDDIDRGHGFSVRCLAR